MCCGHVAIDVCPMYEPTCVSLQGTRVQLTCSVLNQAIFKDRSCMCLSITVGGSQHVPINCGSYIRALTVGGHNACLLTAVVILHVLVLN